MCLLVDVYQYFSSAWGIAGFWICTYSILLDISKLLSKDIEPVYFSYRQYMTVFKGLHPCQYLVCQTFIFASLMRVKFYLIIIICISLITSELEHFFRCSLVISFKLVSFSEMNFHIYELSFNIFPQTPVTVFIFSPLSCRSLSCPLEKLLSVTCITHIFSSNLLAYHFTLFMVLFLIHRFSFFKNKFIYLFLFLAVLGLRCCMQAFSSCDEWGLLFVAVLGLLIVVASLVVKHRP